MKSHHVLGLLAFGIAAGVSACEPAQSPRGTEPTSSAASATPALAVKPAHPTPAAALLILAKRDETLAIVDPQTLEAIAKVPVGHDPHEVIASADGAVAYVSNYGHGAYNTLARVDLASQSARPAIDLGPLRGPHGLTFVGGKVWFTAEGSKAIGSFDPASSLVDWAMGTGQDRTHMIYVAPDLKHIITTNVSSGTVSFLEKSLHRQGPPPGGGGPGGRPPGPPPGSPGGPPGGGPPPPSEDWEQTLIEVGSGSEGFDLSPITSEAWTADAQDGTIAVLDVTKKSLIQKISANVRGANRLKFTVDGKLVLVSTLGGGDLVVFDAATRAEVKRIPIGHGAAGILMQPDGARAYVACSPDNYVAVIDLKSLTVVGKIQAGTEPDGMAWAVSH